MISRTFQTRSGKSVAIPLFLPVYQPHRNDSVLQGWPATLPVNEGCIVNAYFLYKVRAIKARLLEEGLHAFAGFDGVMATDSGAFQAFTRTVYLRNRDIVRFQDEIGSDVIAPFDIVTPPGDSRTTATAKMERTHKRVEEGLSLVERGILAGVQQGGRFLDLRQRSTESLLELGVEYLALGSLVPFFNRNHDLRFVGRVTSDARKQAGDDMPIHLYGSGDPVEMPFLVHLGVTIFDSASYGHYARGGWYMTPFGAVKNPADAHRAGISCGCPECEDGEEIGESGLIRHNLWTIGQTIAAVRRHLARGTLDEHLELILERHAELFPDSHLMSSWGDLAP